MEQQGKNAGNTDSQRNKRIISDTAMITMQAYEAADVPLTKEFLQAMRSPQAGDYWLVQDKKTSITPEQSLLLRARYLGSEVVLRRRISEGTKVVVERAAGLYQMGFNITRDNPVTYVETDISDDFSLKGELCNRVRENMGANQTGR